MARSIKEIALEIQKDWHNINFGAYPYLQAMLKLDTLDDFYYMDQADSIVLYFLANANTWKGEVARRIKAELKTMVKNYQNEN